MSFDPTADLRVHALLQSYKRCRGVALCELDELWTAPFVVLAQDTAEPPIFFFGNRQALTLWELSWEQLTSMPTHETAPPEERAARAQQLNRALDRGYLAGYSGVRVSRRGRRFEIQDAFIWTICDSEQQVLGQAATFASWRYLDEGAVR